MHLWQSMQRVVRHAGHERIASLVLFVVVDCFGAVLGFVASGSLSSTGTSSGSLFSVSTRGKKGFD